MHAVGGWQQIGGHRGTDQIPAATGAASDAGSQTQRRSESRRLQHGQETRKRLPSLPKRLGTKVSRCSKGRLSLSLARLLRGSWNVRGKTAISSQVVYHT